MKLTLHSFPLATRWLLPGLMALALTGCARSAYTLSFEEPAEKKQSRPASETKPDHWDLSPPAVIPPPLPGPPIVRDPGFPKLRLA